MEELIAWCERQITAWQEEISNLNDGSLVVQQRDPSADWKDITGLVMARTRDDVARLRSLLGRLDAGVIVETDQDAALSAGESGLD
jgi:hypothetical protein